VKYAANLPYCTNWLNMSCRTTKLETDLFLSYDTPY
jgi:hypothetical protein